MATGRVRSTLGPETCSQCIGEGGPRQGEIGGGQVSGFDRRAPRRAGDGVGVELWSGCRSAAIRR